MRKPPRKGREASGDRTASDGLLARENGDWGELKLEFLDQFGPPAIDATARKLRRIYIDLFAGPGRNVDKAQPDREFESGGLRILRMHGHLHQDLTFTDAILVNLEAEDHDALSQRVAKLEAAGQLAIPRSRIILVLGDANSLIPETLERFNRRDYFLVFSDPESPSQWPWRSVEALRARGHESLDLYSLLPLEMGIRRLLDFKGKERTKHANILTDFFGTDRWRPIVEARKTPAQRRDMIRRLEELYVSQLRKRWNYADRVLAVRRREGQGLYRMMFASDHEAGKKISDWAKKKAQEGEQLDLGWDR